MAHNREGEGTKFTLDRKIFSSDIWHASPWKLKIWIYLIGHASYKNSTFMGITVKRGQLIRSYRKIAEDCSYKIGYRIKMPSPETIKKICDALEREKRIKRESIKIGTASSVCFVQQNARRSGRNATLFTISNYNDLQLFQKARSGQLEGVHMEQYKNVFNISKDILGEEKPSPQEFKVNPLGKKKRKTQETNPDVRVFILEWIESFSQKFKETYMPNWAKEGKLVQEMLKVYGIEKLRKLKKVFFSSEDPFIKNSGYTIGVFKNQLSKLIVEIETDPFEQAKRKQREEYW